MKAVATKRSRSAILGVKRDAARIMKSTSIEFRGEKFTLSDEMKECFLKLSDMVPDVPRNESGNIDGTVLMQYVIDYILDLELQLDGQGPFSMSPAAAAFSSSLQARFAEASPRTRDCREPLSEKNIDNIVSSQFLLSPSLPSEALLSRTSLDCEIRPPSK